MNMYVHATYNLFICMYMCITCTYMFKIIGNLVNMYRHVCTMFSDVRTVLPILVQVVRIPDGKIKFRDCSAKLAKAQTELFPRYHYMTYFKEVETQQPDKQRCFVQWIPTVTFKL